MAVVSLPGTPDGTRMRKGSQGTQSVGQSTTEGEGSGARKGLPRVRGTRKWETFWGDRNVLYCDMVWITWVYPFIKIVQ